MLSLVLCVCQLSIQSILNKSNGASMFLAILRDDFSLVGIGESVEEAFEALHDQESGVEIDDCDFYDLVNPVRFTYVLTQR